MHDIEQFGNMHIDMDKEGEYKYVCVIILWMDKYVKPSSLGRPIGPNQKKKKNSNRNCLLSMNPTLLLKVWWGKRTHRYQYPYKDPLPPFHKFSSPKNLSHYAISPLDFPFLCFGQPSSCPPDSRSNPSGNKVSSVSSFFPFLQLLKGWVAVGIVSANYWILLEGNHFLFFYFFSLFSIHSGIIECWIGDQWLRHHGLQP